MMAETTEAPRVSQILAETKQLTTRERLVLARLVLDSALIDELDEDVNWPTMGLKTLQKDWDNAEDAVYDNWRAHYDISAR